jgi:hypothetical protein
MISSFGFHYLLLLLTVFPRIVCIGNGNAEEENYWDGS